MLLSLKNQLVEVSSFYNSHHGDWIFFYRKNATSDQCSYPYNSFEFPVLGNIHTSSNYSEHYCDASTNDSFILQMTCRTHNINNGMCKIGGKGVVTFRVYTSLNKQDLITERPMDRQCPDQGTR